LQKHRIVLCHVERQLLPCFDKTLETTLGLFFLPVFKANIFESSAAKSA
jgi:hypothetical protein